MKCHNASTRCDNIVIFSSCKKRLLMLLANMLTSQVSRCCQVMEQLVTSQQVAAVVLKLVCVCILIIKALHHLFL